MKQSESNKFPFEVVASWFAIRLRILKANIINTFHVETAFWLNNWGNLVSTIVYSAATIVFINILYANVNTIAGYDYQEMLFFFLIGELTFFISWTVSIGNMQDLVVSVNRGDLDLVLTKPVPALFYVSLKKINLVSMIRDALPPLFVLFVIVDWGKIISKITVQEVVIGCVIWVMGLFCWHTLQLLFAIPAFRFGESGELLGLLWSFDSFNRIPSEGFGKIGRIAIGVLVPVVITTGFTASVMLGKSDPWSMFVIVSMITIGAFYIRHRVWRWALSQYTSASS